jgi:tetratricopeptide (TPR) repeat protein
MSASVRSRLYLFFFPIVFCLSAWDAYAAGNLESARRLVQVTSLESILRTDAEQAGMIADRLPEDLPQELRSSLRRAIDGNLDYNRMEEALLKSLSSKIDAETIDVNSRWWASSSGREIAKAESSIFASLFGDSTFEAYNPTAHPADASNAGPVEEVLATGKFAEFVSDLLQSTAQLRRCILSSLDVTAGSDCAERKTPSGNQADQLARSIRPIAAARLLKVSSGDLNAYLAYLRSTKALATMAALRAAEAQVERVSWKKAVEEANTAVDAYARSHFGHVDDAALREIDIDIDAGRNLPQDRFSLLLMARGSAPNPAVLLQLARVTLKLPQEYNEPTGPPSVPGIDKATLESARRYIELALSLDANRADAVMISGHIAYLQRRFQQSAELLERAKAMGGSSPWLRINLGDALWAIAMQPPAVNRTISQQAADEFETALKSPLPGDAEERAVHQLGDIYAQLGDIPKADSYQRRFVAMVQGCEKPYALQRYAHFLFFDAKDDDGAIAAARQALQGDNSPVGQTFLAQLLVIKGGDLVSRGRPKEAVRFLNEARSLQPDLESLCPDLAWLPALYPGVVGIHSSGAIKDFSGRIGGETLVHAALYATSKQIEQLLSWGANPNYFDPDDGTPLHHAIMADNLAAVKTLLAHGASPLTPFIDGRLPWDLVNPSDARRDEILAIVRKAAGERGVAATVTGAPFKVRYEYLAMKDRSGMFNGHSWGDTVAAGQHLVFIDECRYGDSSLACFRFKISGDPRLHEVAIQKDQLVSWAEWFKEIGPERAESR